MEQFKLSNRLKNVAELINKGNVVADIGTDHGYLPVYIVKENISDRVIAMDVRKGPLQKAKENVAAYKVKENVETRLSDGLFALSENEAQTITICGMGGELIQSILDRGMDKFDENTQLILSPQSEIKEFRQYLYINGYDIRNECMLKEEGQFYVIFDCRKKKTETKRCLPLADLETEVAFRFGRSLLEQKNEALYEYLLKERRNNEKVLGVVKALEKKDDAVINRIRQLEKDAECISKALEYYK